jgi:hypothetical protein
VPYEEGHITGIQMDISEEHEPSYYQLYLDWTKSANLPIGAID